MAAFLILISSFCLSANDLPNDYAIIATEANARLATAAPWSRVLFIVFVEFPSLKVCGHALTLWQIHDKGIILVYDADIGTRELDTHSQELKDIVPALNKLNPAHPILAAHFVQ